MQTVINRKTADDNAAVLDELPCYYFSHSRSCIQRWKMLMMKSLSLLQRRLFTSLQTDCQQVDCR